MKKTLLLILIVTNPVFAAENVVRIYKQWHLLAKIKTDDIEFSKKRINQFKNQKFIYHHIDNLIKKKSIKAVISEGCQGEINSGFTRTFNSWNYKKLNNFLIGKA